ncbi:MAG: hypothetical protein ACE5FW_01865 [Candidatus Aenigmatarchaeota archaeon]
MVNRKLNSLERQLVRLDGAFLEIRPENSPEFSQIKQMLGQGLHAKFFF